MAWRNWIAVALLAGIAYVVFGVVFGELAAHADTHQMVVAWRLAAWITSALVFAAHALREIRATGLLNLTALRAAVGASIGTFGLAVAAVLHSMWAPPEAQTANRIHLALIVWPAVTFIPAYLAGFVASAVFKKLATNN